MGLDQYAYAAAKAGNWDNSKELAYWRKHPNLQGWMEARWIEKLAAQGIKPEDSPWGSSFNGVELELTIEDLEDLERDIRGQKLPTTQGFFFGNNSDNHYFEQDIAFIYEAKADILCGLKVFYNSSW